MKYLAFTLPILITLAVGAYNGLIEGSKQALITERTIAYQNKINEVIFDYELAKSLGYDRISNYGISLNERGLKQ